MDNKISPIQNKTFDDFIKEFKTHNKLILLNSSLQSKYTSEIANEDGDKREKQLDDANESLKEISDRLKNLLKGVDKNNEKLLAKIEKLKAPEIKPLKDIKDTEPLTLKEKLKTQVASIKSFGSKVKDTVSGVTEAIKSPTDLFTKAKSSATSVGKGLLGDIKEIAGTKKEYSVEGERFAKLYSQTAKGTQFQKGGKGSLEVGMETFNKLKEKEKEIKALEDKIKKFESYGFEAPKKDTKELDKLKKEYGDIDVRSKQAKETPITSKEVEAKEPKETLITSRESKSQINPESDNIVTSEEKVSDLTEQLVSNSDKSFRIFEEQLKELKLIKEYLAPKEEKQTPKEKAKVEPKPEEKPSPSIPDIPGKSARSIGSKMSKGLKGGISGGAAAGGVAALGASAALLGGLTYLGFQKESQIAETKDEAVVKKAGLDENLASGAASIEEAAGSGLSKEDEIFKKDTRPFWKRFLPRERDSTEVTPVTSTTGNQMAQASAENQMLKQEASQPAPPTIINNTNTVSSNQQSVAPIRTLPRPTSNSFERKMMEVASF